MSQTMDQRKQDISEGNTYLGIEFGSTRIKAVLIDETMAPIAQGSHTWENRLNGQYWTYSQEDIITGMQSCYRDLADQVSRTYGVSLETVKSIGISAMMHGYLAFDRNGELLAPFRTWRNTTTGQAAKELTELFQYNIPLRWSIAHLHQAVLNGEAHVPQIASINTLAGYVHRLLAGTTVLGVGDASGMFPIDPETRTYDETKLDRYEKRLEPFGYPWQLRTILPQVLVAGEDAGSLTREGAKLLDPSGRLKPGIRFCPPEGDAGTGMAATNSVAVRTGNVSAGTSVFAMVVLERGLSRVYPEIDLVTTPTGNLVGMVHCNNCTSDLNAWVGLFSEYTKAMGFKADADQIYGTLYRKALEGDKDCGGLLSYCYLSGEPITELEEGRPLFVRNPDSHFNLANFMRTHLYSSLATLKIGLDILFQQERVQMDRLMGHGGFFKTKGVGQSMMAAASGVPVSVMETAGEGGAWGIALLAAYAVQKTAGETLEDFLNTSVFAAGQEETVAPKKEDMDGFDAFITRYRDGLCVERGAVAALKR